MGKDFYLDEYALAAYFEKDWFDHVIATGGARPGRFAFAPFDLRELYCPYHEHFADLIKRAANDARPGRMLEIGASLGRGFAEIRSRFDSLTHATLVEPSRNLYDLAAKILGTREDAKPVEWFRVLKGNGELVDVRMDTRAARAGLAALELAHLNEGFGDVQNFARPFDLVVCSNVLDQCDHPLALVDLLQRATAPGGTLAVSCTYQWQPKYAGLPARAICHLDELFRPEEGWRLAAEENIPFRVRINERHWMTFLSHACVFTRSQ